MVANVWRRSWNRTDPKPRTLQAGCRWLSYRLSATEYQAQVILSDGITGLEDSYDLPVMQHEIDLALLKRLETAASMLADTS